MYRWYQGFDWEGLRSQTLVPPIQPKVRIPQKIHFSIQKFSSETQKYFTETSFVHLVQSVCFASRVWVKMIGRSITGT